MKLDEYGWWIIIHGWTTSVYGVTDRVNNKVFESSLSNAKYLIEDKIINSGTKCLVVYIWNYNRDDFFRTEFHYDINYNLWFREGELPGMTFEAMQSLINEKLGEYRDGQ